MQQITINPVLNFPEFPAVTDNNEKVLINLDENTNTISMPLYLWLDIVDYVNYVEEQKRIYKKCLQAQ